MFGGIRRGDILVHLPYHSSGTSILRFLQSAAADPAVLAIKLTIYRTGRRSPIIRALKEAEHERGQAPASPRQALAGTICPSICPST